MNATESLMTPEEALREARSGNLRPFYLVIGEETHLASGVVRAIREAALTGGVAGLNEDQLMAGESDVQAVLAAARTLPMMAKRRFVLVRNVERWDTKSDRGDLSPLDRLLSYAEQPAPSSVLVAVAGKLDKRRRLVTQANKLGFLVSCDALTRAELPRWIEQAAGRRGNPIKPHVADLIAELAGPELSPVADAVERVCLFVGAGQEVTEAAVAECVIRLRPATIWELVGAVGRRDAGAALQALESVYDPQDRGLRLLGVLAWSTRQLIKFEAALSAGRAAPEAAKLAGAPPFKARELSDQVRRLTRADLEGFLQVLGRVDLALKGGSKRPPKAVLEHAILELCGAQMARTGRPGARSLDPHGPVSHV